MTATTHDEYSAVLNVVTGKFSGKFSLGSLRMTFDSWAEFEALADRHAPPKERDLPCAKSARQVPTAVRARLDAVAQQLGYANRLAA